jgi:hypothetical protein
MDRLGEKVRLEWRGGERDNNRNVKRKGKERERERGKDREMAKDLFRLQTYHQIFSRTRLKFLFISFPW